LSPAPKFSAEIKACFLPCVKGSDDARVAKACDSWRAC
jgi:hypothetical protein